MPYTVIGGIGELNLSEGAAMSNAANVMTLNNVVLLCGDCTLTSYTANGVFATLSKEDLYPGTEIRVPVCVTSDGVTRLTFLTVGTEGTLSLPFDYTSAVVHLNGICFNVNSKYYTPEIGNIYNDGTSPLTEARL